MAAKNIEKYLLWLWSLLVKILELSLVALWPPTRDKSNIFTRDDHNHM